MKILTILFKGFRRLIRIMFLLYGQLIAYILLKLNGATIEKGLRSRGIPIVDVSLRGRFVLGRNFVMNNGKIEEMGYAEEIYHKPQSEYTKNLISSIPKGDLDDIRKAQLSRKLI